jgi:toxin ParE1/3/4
MWGDDQADTSIREIHAAFLRLAETPFLGMARPDIHVGYRSLPVQQHIVFYTLTDDAAFVNVIGVLHARMDMHGHLP